MKKIILLCVMFNFVVVGYTFAGQMITLPDKIVLTMPTDQCEYLGHEIILGAANTGVAYGGAPVNAVKVNIQLIGEGSLRVRRSYYIQDIADNPDTPEDETGNALTTMLGDNPNAATLEQRMKAHAWGKLQAEFPLLSDVLTQICP